MSFIERRFLTLQDKRRTFWLLFFCFLYFLPSAVGAQISGCHFYHLPFDNFGVV